MISTKHEVCQSWRGVYNITSSSDNKARRIRCPPSPSESQVSSLNLNLSFICNYDLFQLYERLKWSAGLAQWVSYMSYGRTASGLGQTRAVCPHLSLSAVLSIVTASVPKKAKSQKSKHLKKESKHKHECFIKLQLFLLNFQSYRNLFAGRIF